MRTFFLPTLASVALSAGCALADVGVEIQFDGYDETAKQCEFAFAYTDFGAGFSKIDFAYEVHVRGQQIRHCTDIVTEEFTDTSCRVMPDVENIEHTCDEITKVRPVVIRCFDAGGSQAECGPIKIRGSDIFTFN